MKRLKDKPKSKPKKGASRPEDDKALWKAVTETVEPLKGRETVFLETALPLDALGREVDVLPPPKRARPNPRPAQALTVAVATPPLPELSHGFQPGLDKATAKRLRRGQVQIEGRLDLHGMIQDEARPALERFIEAAWRSDKREVLVITGKGTRADGSIGVLRQMVPQWLNAPPNRARVTAFTHASAKDGGEGALYVRIKRRAKTS